MTFKACKYLCNTQIQWDTELSAFRESDGKLHDRKRCEGLRNNGGSGSPTQQQQQQVQSPSSTPMATYDVASTLNTILSQVKLHTDAVALINQKLEQLSEYYSGIYEYIRNQQKADSEALYDQDKDDGLV